MATTQIHQPPRADQRPYLRTEERSSYAAVWGLLALALLAAVAYGYYRSDDADDLSTVSATQASNVTPAVGEGTTSSMIGTGPASNELTPSSTTPGTPDTTTTESSPVPSQGY